jgi:hypothetical protein
MSNLTPEQEAAIPSYVKWGLTKGRSCEPADRPKAEKAIKGIYARLKMPDPEFIWVASPKEANKVINENKGRPEGNVDWNCFYGQHSVAWIARYNFLVDQKLSSPNAEVLEALQWFEDLAESCMWWWPFEKAVIVCDRPSELHIDDFGRLSNKTGPAALFRDGWGAWVINGTNVPKRIVLEADKITIEEVEEETNQEVRAIMIEQMGFEKFLESAETVIVDQDTRPVGGGVGDVCHRVLLKDSKDQLWLMCDDGGTDRPPFFLRVVGDIGTCAKAHESLCGLSDDKVLIQS